MIISNCRNCCAAFASSNVPATFVVPARDLSAAGPLFPYVQGDGVRLLTDLCAGVAANTTTAALAEMTAAGVDLQVSA